MDHLQLTSRTPWETGIQPEVDLEFPGNDCNGHALSAAQQLLSRCQQPNMNMAANETKPRLGKDEVDLLEREFLKSPKPSTQTKRQFAEDMGVDLARVNNWFQNRRAKRKQEKKQIMDDEQQAQEVLNSGQDLEMSSPDIYEANQYYADNSTLSTTAKQENNIPPHEPVYCPQFSDPSAATMESLFRTLTTAEILHSKIDQGGMTESQFCRDIQLVESKDVSEFDENASNTLAMRDSSELLGDIATLAGQTKVSPNKVSHVVPLSHFPARTHDKNMSTTTSCTPDETTASDSSTTDPEESWELLPRCVDGGEEDQAQIKSQVLDPMRQALVERIMDEFRVLYNHSWTCKTTQCTTNSSPTTKHIKQDGSTGDSESPPSSPASYPKRPRSRDEESADEDGNRRHRKQGRRPASSLADSPQFSCPFRKHDPEKYNIHSHRVCALTGWDTIARVKEEQPIELDISTKAPLATTPDVEESIKAAEEVERVGYPSADFSESVIQPSPVFEEGYVVDFFPSDLGHSDSIAPFNVQLDSAYVSIPQCSCKEECLCFTPTMYMEDSNIDVVEPILDGIPGDVELPANLDRWQDWTSADFEPRESAWR
ncbi:hypothetical protein BKA61DRAFT_739471 [Leptodontidium sp. MPI-SDFR-AT-0119]|nr:hypothetical protein BKA61DRAFT_739471 [Leptodontidium sp. MPI-SDFR-AT-0119]